MVGLASVGLALRQLRWATVTEGSGGAGVSGRADSAPAGPLRVLVVDDSEPIRRLVARALASESFVVDEAADGHQARQRLDAEHPDVVVLDVELPDTSGFDLLREILATTDIPVVMLSSRREEFDRVLGLEMGAEDYVVKPFLPRELAARVRRAARRRPAASAARLEFPGLTIDPATREVLVEGQAVELTGREFDLLTHLAAAAGVLPPGAARPGLALVRRLAEPQDRHRARPARPQQDRGRPGPAPLGEDRRQRRLPVRSLTGRSGAGVVTGDKP
jgi:two-component system response regulator ResD